MEQNVSPVTLESVQAELRQLKTPLVRDEWVACLREHPDRDFVSYLVKGISDGFRVGFDYSDHTCHSAKANMQSAINNETVVQERLQAEVNLGRVIGPLEADEFPTVQVSHFGVIPKNHQPGKWRMIVDLSHPRGWSVNECISPELCSMHYTSVDEAV